jgi:enoyl-CoA hydratase
MKTVNFQQAGSHAILRFNRPHRLNAVTEEVYGDLGRALDDALDNPSIRTNLLAGEGRAFCAGADLKERGAGSRSESEKRDYARMEQQICLRLQTVDKPCVAVVHGYALGAGAEIALSN